MAGYVRLRLSGQLDTSMKMETENKERRIKIMEFTQKEKDRLVELKAKEAKDAKSLTAAEQTELKNLRAKK
jgi:hypothetical protein